MLNPVQPGYCQYNQTNRGGGMAMLGALMPLLQMLMMMAAQVQFMAGGRGPVSSQNPQFGGRGLGAGGGGGLGNFLGTGSAPTAGPGSGGPNAAAPVGAKTGQLTDLGGGKKVDSSIAPNVKAMIAAAKRDSVDLKITSAHRSRHEQEVLYQKYLNGTGNLAAKPGSSNHESGLAIDFTNTPGAHEWLKKNAGRFGLKNLPGESWHYSTNTSVTICQYSPG